MAFQKGGQSNGPVGSGIDCFLMQENTLLAYSTELNVSEDWHVEGIQTLGFFGFRNFLSMGYTCEFDLGTFLLRGADIAGSVSMPGFESDGTVNINSSGLYTFTALDVSTLIVLFTIMGSQYSGGNLKVAQGELMTRSTKWKARMMLPGLQTS
jgi:hypothetical protein